MLAVVCVISAVFVCGSVLVWVGVFNEGRQTPRLVADVVIPADEEGEFVLIQRERGPFDEQWALPGGFVAAGETAEEAAVREVREETGLRVEPVRLLGVYSRPERDPRGHFISVVYLARPVGGELMAGEDVVETRRIDPQTVDLAFNHRQILNDFVEENASQATVAPGADLP